MEEQGPPKPYTPDSLLDFVNDDTLTNMLTGFRERAGLGITMFCKNKEGQLIRINPEEKTEEQKTRYWSEICTWFRITRNNETICVDADKKKAMQLLEKVLPGPHIYKCKPLGLIEMAAQIIVNGKPIGAVIIGQRLPREILDREEIKRGMLRKYPDGAAEIKEVFEVEKSHDIEGRDTSSICNEEEVEVLLRKLKNFTQIINDICNAIVNWLSLLRKREFVGYWIKILSDKQPADMIAWQILLHNCLQSFHDFTKTDIERIGFFHGIKNNERIDYSLVAMNSTNLWNIEPFYLLEGRFVKPKFYGPGKLAKPFREAFARPSEKNCKNFADKKYFYIFPFAQTAKESFGEMYSLIIIQMAEKSNKDLIEFCRDFCDNLCRYDATLRLYLRQIDTYEKYKEQVTLVRHNLKTSLQHVMVNLDEYIILTKNKLPESDKDKANNQWRITRSSMREHKDNTTTLVSPTEMHEKSIVHIDVYKRISELATLYTAYAKHHKNAIFDTKGLPRNKVYVRCNSVDFDNAVAAILENAIKYSYSDWKTGITISLKGITQNGQTEIIFENYGIGIPPLKKINERTVRGYVKDTKRKRPGEGLGLYIASSVFIDQLDGTIVANSRKTKNINSTVDDLHEHIVQITVKIPTSTKE